MRRFVFVSVAVSAMLFSAPAFAADGPGFQPYAGVTIGYDSVVPKWDQAVAANTTVATSSTKSIAYGAVFGVDSNVGKNLRLGVEAEVTGGGGSGSVNWAASDPLTTASDVKQTGITYGRDIFIGIRTGVMVTPKLLLFAKGGYDNAHAKLSSVETTTTPAAIAGNPPTVVVTNGVNSTSLNGYRVGAGLEYGTKVKLRVEYDYTHYFDAYNQAVNTHINASRSQIMTGLIYGF